MIDKAAPRILSTVSRELSPWVTLQERYVERSPGSTPEAYHSLSQADYVSVLALTADGQVPLVRQFRPAIQGLSIELPGGLAESDEDAMVTAERELFEETGHRPTESLLHLGTLTPDTGRLENRLHCYFARGVAMDSDWVPEPGVELLLMSAEDFKVSVEEGKFDHALHVAILGLAVLRGLI